ncbi:MAG: 16S rRNA (cytidine(1402)-2'-O)-methyltransferase [Candidatus Omnitrophica bacterium]|nr:16S rRNA (cytidine(1402)-2'-O)-methyltransferase [Candidatus Omnitrophota bacterium]
MKEMLYIVSTPIGNLKDITFRAIETLRSVDLIAAEDTRHTKILLEAYQIQRPLTSFFEHNQLKKTEGLLELLKAGKSVALVTDAGTPGISDPGFLLVRRAMENNVPVSVIPGASACLTALTASGLPAHRFLFEGFLPIKSGARRHKLESLKGFKGTLIFYESPHRLLKTLKDMQDVWEDPVIVVARELTKKFEEVLRDKTSRLMERFRLHAPKGEFVLLRNEDEDGSLHT